MFYSTAIFKGAGLKDQCMNITVSFLFQICNFDFQIQFRAKLCHHHDGCHQHGDDACVRLSGQWETFAADNVYCLSICPQVDHPRFGRRTLHLAGMVGMCFSTGMIAVSMLVAKVTIGWNKGILCKWQSDPSIHQNPMIFSRWNGSRSCPSSSFCSLSSRLQLGQVQTAFWIVFFFECQNPMCMFSRLHPMVLRQWSVPVECARQCQFDCGADQLVLCCPHRHLLPHSWCAFPPPKINEFPQIVCRAFCMSIASSCSPHCSPCSSYSHGNSCRKRRTRSWPKCKRRWTVGGEWTPRRQNPLHRLEAKHEWMKMPAQHWHEWKWWEKMLWGDICRFLRTKLTAKKLTKTHKHIFKHFSFSQFINKWQTQKQPSTTFHIFVSFLNEWMNECLSSFFSHTCI